MKLSIKTKATALFLGYVLALAAVYATFSFRLLDRENRAAVDHLQQTADILAAEIQGYLDDGRQRLEMVGRLPGLTFGLQNIAGSTGGREIPAWTTLHYLFFKSPLFTQGVFLLDRSATVVWNEPPDRGWRGRSLAEHPVVREALERSSTVVSDACGKDGLSDGPHAFVIHPIRPREGDVVGFLGGVIGLEAARFLDSTNAASTLDEKFVVTDSAGRVVASSSGLPLLQPWTPPEEKDRSVIASKAVAGSGWRVWASQPRYSALASVQQLQRLLLGLGLGLIAASVLVSVPSIRDFTRNITALTRHAEVMAAGDLTRPLELPQRGDELGVLAGTLERTRSELQRSRDALEERVTERDELLRLKEEFLANTSHELRTPLNVIFGYAEMLEDGEQDAERRTVIDGIRSQAARLLDLIGDLMTLSGVSAGRINVKRARVDIGQLVGRLAPLADRLAQSKEIELVWDLPPDLPPIHTDDRRLEQVLWNLLANAIKFTSRGKVALHVRHSPDARSFTFVVSDTGIGIPATELPHIFDEFRQVDGSMSRQHGGMGLGLAVARKLVMLLGGEIRVRSLEGFGSAFTVTLPQGEELGADIPGPAARTEHQGLDG